MPIPFLSLSPKISVVPVIHGSGDCALEVRRAMLADRFDCLAVPLPPSFQPDVEQAIGHLPAITLVAQAEPHRFGPVRFDTGDWSPDQSAEDDETDADESPAHSYVPIDPCQPVIAALRVAIEERIARAFIDLETAVFQPLSTGLPDPYALKQVPLEKFAAAVLPALPRLPAGQPSDRVTAMANRLRELEQRYGSILLVCSFLDWPWIKDAYFSKTPQTATDDVVEQTAIHAVTPQTLLFILGELPFITRLYERARAELEDDENLSIDGVKELLLAAREQYQIDLKSRARKLTPHLFATYLKYVRNLSLIERRMTPDLYTLITAAQQFAGDQFAIALAETARGYRDTGRLPYPPLSAGIAQGRLPDGQVVPLKSRLPGPPVSWRTCRLHARPEPKQQLEWQMRWNPFNHCSWPPEDVSIEKFRTHVKDKALAIMGMDLARIEKFSTSLMDGLDIRETLRNWHTGNLYVKVQPPTRGSLDCVIMLFDSPADPRDYPWRTTWMAEHHDESTLALFATDFRREMVGPGIGLATYGGAVFLFPPRPIADIWSDRRFDFADTLEERLVAAACRHSRERHIALLSHAPPGAGWRRLARRFGRKLVHVPLSHFSQETVQQLRLVHVLNGRQIRSYAADFIRKA
ncbi:MAG: hypothetical protein EXS05_09450 [Planctomycetaceae bacterium]|nr:hypothetical protein [Planctomycetaceae bacterium]